MFRQHRGRIVPWALAAALAAGVASGWLAGPSTSAGELEKLDTSLRLVPEDAAFYSTMLRNREQVEIALESRAWARIMDMPVVKMGLAMFQAEAADPGSPAAQVMDVLQDPEKRKSLDLLADLGSHEIFMYGDQSVVESLELMQQMVGAMRFGPMSMELSGEGRGKSPDQMQAAMLFSVLAENPDKIKVPSFVLGFKVKQKELATEHLAMLETLATMALADHEQLKGRFKKTKIAGHEYLTLNLDGSMVPWDEVPIEELRQAEANPGDVDKVMARLKKMTLAVCLGLREDYLIVGVGSTTDCVARLGKGKPLSGRKEFAPLEKFAGKRLTSIEYVSEAMAARVGTTSKDIEETLAYVGQLLPAAGLPEEIEKKIIKDAKALAEDLKRVFPKPGAAMGFSFLTERGSEGYAYDWGEHTELDGSKPLGLLNHLGGSPILAYVSRSKLNPEDYDALVKWIKVGYGYFEEFARPQMGPDDAEKLDAVMKKAMPLVKRLDAANRKLLIPALADGQAALVLDARFTSRQFHEAMPEMEKPMPMIEPAVVLGTSDSKALVKAMSEYREVFNSAWALVREVAPNGEVPDFKIPPPEMEKTKAGALYFYPLPAEWGLDKNILPNAGLSESVAVLTASKGHSQRLLRPTPLKVGGVLAGAADRPLAEVVIFDWAGLVKAATPWVDFAADMALKEQVPDAAQAEAIRQQVHTVLEVLQCLKTYTSESYFEGGALVTHSLTEIQDVK